jgi:uncharacterized membrane protein
MSITLPYTRSQRSPDGISRPEDGCLPLGRATQSRPFPEGDPALPPQGQKPRRQAAPPRSKTDLTVNVINRHGAVVERLDMVHTSRLSQSGLDEANAILVIGILLITQKFWFFLVAIIVMFVFRSIMKRQILKDAEAVNATADAIVNRACSQLGAPLTARQPPTGLHARADKKPSKRCHWPPRTHTPGNSQASPLDSPPSVRMV